jgi:hypothetical protein
MRQPGRAAYAWAYVAGDIEINQLISERADWKPKVHSKHQKFVPRLCYAGSIDAFTTMLGHPTKLPVIVVDIPMTQPLLTAADFLLKWAAKQGVSATLKCP